MAVQRASQFFTKLRPNSAVFNVPEKWRGGRLEKIFNYWNAVRIDYAEALKDIKKGARNRPLKASIITAFGLSAFVSNRLNPNERDFRTHITDMSLSLTEVPNSIRNPRSESWHTSIIRLDNAGLLRCWNLGIFSIIWRADFDKDCGNFLSQCEYLTPGYRDFYDRIVDVGFLGKWWMAEKEMEEYDIQPTEWDSQGSPIEPQNQLKPMW